MAALLCAVLACGCSRQPSGALRVSCAASLGAAVAETAKAEGLTIELNSGGSNALVRQADMGAETDLLLLADDAEARKSLLPKRYSLRSLASNQLVVIGPAATTAGKAPGQGTPGDGTALPAFELQQVLAPARQVAVADAKTAPLGSYTEEALRGLDLKVELVPLQDAQAVVSTVALGHAPLGIVYRSDALAESKVAIVGIVPPQRHRPIRYVAVLPPEPREDCRRLVASLVDGKGKEILAQQGFLPPPLESPPVPPTPVQ